MQRLPDELAARNIAHAFTTINKQAVKALTYHHPDGFVELAAITGPDYGRIWDAEIIAVLDYLLKIDPAWKIPGEIDWKEMKHNPQVDVTKDNTTLFASDRDIFAALFKDHEPIEAGKTATGEPDLYFPGFWLRNSQTGHGKAELAMMMLRGVCFNRTLWGVQDFKSVTIKHSKKAADRFEDKASRAVRELTSVDAKPFVVLLDNARKTKIADNDEEAIDFFGRLKITQKAAKEMLTISMDEEQHPVRSVYDASMAMTAAARRNPFGDQRLDLERKAIHILEKAA
jgi:hypothetical protein